MGARLLDRIERLGNRLPDPVSLFVLLAVGTVVSSKLAVLFGWSAVHPTTGKEVLPVDLLSSEGLRRTLTGIVEAFTSFAPLGTVLTVMIGIGVAERSGLFAAALERLVRAVPARWVAPGILLGGMLSHVAADAGYVVLIPLAALLYASLGRPPLAGLAVAFAGVAAGFSANLLLSALDPMLAGITQEGARLLAPEYRVLATSNYYFTAASVFLLTAVGWFVSDRIVEPRLRAQEQAAADGERPSPTALRVEAAAEAAGLRAAGWAALLTLGAITLLVAPPGAVLRDPATGEIGPFYSALVSLILIAFLVPGLAYGWRIGTIRSDRDITRLMTEAMAALGSYIVLAFFAGQFIALFKRSELGPILAIRGAQTLRDVGLAGVPLMLAFVVVTALLNLLIASASAKWAAMAPVFVPMMMVLGFSPELTQALYRVGDSVTNVITPLNPYVPMVIVVARLHRPTTGLGTLLAAMMPFSLAFGVTWTVLVILWASLGLPLGPGAPLHFTLH